MTTDAKPRIGPIFALERVRSVREECIRLLLAHWEPERHPEILAIGRRLTASRAERPPDPVPA